MRKYNLKYQIAAGVILVISGTLVLLSDYIKEKRDVVFSEMNLALSGVVTKDTIPSGKEEKEEIKPIPCAAPGGADKDELKWQGKSKRMKINRR